MNNIGRKIYGFCNGYFGRDDYDDKIIVYETELAICCIYTDDEMYGVLTTANFNTEKEKQDYINKWSVKEEE